MKAPRENQKDGSKSAVADETEPAKTTVAVALQVPADNPQAIPRVVATGRGEFAETLLDIAFRTGVKVRQDADLAEILAAVDLDSEIPVEAFIAVAEILRYVYAANAPTGADNSPHQAPSSP